MNDFFKGERTNDLNEAHVEFFRGLDNPIGIKISNKLKISSLLKIIDILNPDNEKSKIILHLRLGVNKLEDYVNELCSELKKKGIQFV